MSTKAKLSIFVVCGKSPLTAFGGGYSTIGRNIGKNLASLGQNVYLIALGDKSEEQKTNFGTLVTLQVPLIRVDISALPGLPVYSFLFAKTIRSLVKREGMKNAIVWGIGPWGLAGTILRHLFRVRIIHITSYFTTARHEWQGGLKALRVSDYGWFLRIKFLVIYHTIVRMISFLDCIVIKTSDVIISNYRSTEEILRKEFRVSSSQFLRTTFPVEAYARKTNTSDNGRPGFLHGKYMLYLSRHDPRKGINFLLHAMKILSRKIKPMPLIIAGTGELFEANKKLSERLGVSRWVKFTGFINDPVALMKHATIFCFPTLEEGAGALIINEAMSMGLPIVATACDGIREDLKDRESALLVPPGDSEAFAHALEKLIASPTLRTRLGSGAKQKYETLYNPSVIREDFTHLLNRLSRMSI